MVCSLDGLCFGMTHPFGVSYRPRGVNANTFLDSSNCFARLRKNSLPVSVVRPKMESRVNHPLLQFITNQSDISKTQMANINASAQGGSFDTAT